MKINAIFSYKNTIYYFFVHVPSLCNISSYCLKTQNANLKARVTRNQSPQHFPKINISYLLILTRKCAYQGVRTVNFRLFLRALSSCGHSFKVRPLALLPTYCSYHCAKSVQIRSFFGPNTEK